MTNVGSFFDKNSSTKFIVRNIAPGNKRVRVFNYPINNGEVRDLIDIPGLSEGDIRHSLLKGELLIKIKNKELIIVDSDIDLIQFNAEQLAFLQESGVPNGIIVNTSTTTNFVIDSLLIGIQNSSNTIFTISSGKFLFDSINKITVYVNGVRQAITQNFLVAESGGPGTGYDTVVFIEAPAVQDVLVADYYQA